MRYYFVDKLKKICMSPDNAAAIINKIIQEAPSEFFDIISSVEDYAIIWAVALKGHGELAPLMDPRLFLVETEYRPLAQKYPDIKKAFHLVTRGDSKYYVRKESKCFGGVLLETLLTPTHLIAVYSKESINRFLYNPLQKLTFIGTNVKTISVKKTEKHIFLLGPPEAKECHMSWTGNEIKISVGNELSFMDPEEFIIRRADNSNNLPAPVVAVAEK